MRSIDCPSAQRRGAQPVEHQAIGAHLIRVVQQQAAGQVLGVHHGRVGRVGEVEHGERADQVHLGRRADRQHLERDLAAVGHLG